MSENTLVQDIKSNRMLTHPRFFRYFAALWLIFLVGVFPFSRENKPSSIKGITQLLNQQLTDYSQEVGDYARSLDAASVNMYMRYLYRNILNLIAAEETPETAALLASPPQEISFLAECADGQIFGLATSRDKQLIMNKENLSKWETSCAELKLTMEVSWNLPNVEALGQTYAQAGQSWHISVSEQGTKVDEVSAFICSPKHRVDFGVGRRLVADPRREPVVQTLLPIISPVWQEHLLNAAPLSVPEILTPNNSSDSFESAKVSVLNWLSEYSIQGFTCLESLNPDKAKNEYAYMTSLLTGLLTTSKADPAEVLPYPIRGRGIMSFGLTVTHTDGTYEWEWLEGPLHPDPINQINPDAITSIQMNIGLISSYELHDEQFVKLILTPNGLSLVSDTAYGNFVGADYVGDIDQAQAFVQSLAFPELNPGARQSVITTASTEE